LEAEIEALKAENAKLNAQRKLHADAEQLLAKWDKLRSSRASSSSGGPARLSGAAAVPNAVPPGRSSEAAAVPNAIHPGQSSGAAAVANAVGPARWSGAAAVPNAVRASPLNSQHPRDEADMGGTEALASPISQAAQPRVVATEHFPTIAAPEDPPRASCPSVVDRRAQSRSPEVRKSIGDADCFGAAHPQQASVCELGPLAAESGPSAVPGHAVRMPHECLDQADGNPHVSGGSDAGWPWELADSSVAGSLRESGAQRSLDIADGSAAGGPMKKSDVQQQPQRNVGCSAAGSTEKSSAQCRLDHADCFAAGSLGSLGAQRSLDIADGSAAGGPMKKSDVQQQPQGNVGCSGAGSLEKSGGQCPLDNAECFATGSLGSLGAQRSLDVADSSAAGGPMTKSDVQQPQGSLDYSAAGRLEKSGGQCTLDKAHCYSAAGSLEKSFAQRSLDIADGSAAGSPKKKFDVGAAHCIATQISLGLLSGVQWPWKNSVCSVASGLEKPQGSSAECPLHNAKCSAADGKVEPDAQSPLDNADWSAACGLKKSSVPCPLEHADCSVAGGPKRSAVERPCENTKSSVAGDPEQFYVQRSQGFAEYSSAGGPRKSGAQSPLGEADRSAACGLKKSSTPCPSEHADCSEAGGKKRSAVERPYENTKSSVAGDPKQSNGQRSWGTPECSSAGGPQKSGAQGPLDDADCSAAASLKPISAQRPSEHANCSVAGIAKKFDVQRPWGDADCPVAGGLRESDAWLGAQAEPQDNREPDEQDKQDPLGEDRRVCPSTCSGPQAPGTVASSCGNGSHGSHGDAESRPDTCLGIQGSDSTRPHPPAFKTSAANDGRPSAGDSCMVNSIGFCDGHVASLLGSDVFGVGAHQPPFALLRTSRPPILHLRPLVGSLGQNMPPSEGDHVSIQCEQNVAAPNAKHVFIQCEQKGALRMAECVSVCSKQKGALPNAAHVSVHGEQKMALPNAAHVFVQCEHKVAQPKAEHVSVQGEEKMAASMCLDVPPQLGPPSAPPIPGKYLETDVISCAAHGNPSAPPVPSKCLETNIRSCATHDDPSAPPVRTRIPGKYLGTDIISRAAHDDPTKRFPSSSASQDGGLVYQSGTKPCGVPDLDFSASAGAPKPCAVADLDFSASPGPSYTDREEMQSTEETRRACDAVMSDTEGSHEQHPGPRHPRSCLEGVPDDLGRGYTHLQTQTTDESLPALTQAQAELSARMTTPCRDSKRSNDSRLGTALGVEASCAPRAEARLPLGQCGGYSVKAPDLAVAETDASRAPEHAAASTSVPADCHRFSVSRLPHCSDEAGVANQIELPKVCREGAMARAASGMGTAAVCEQQQKDIRIGQGLGSQSPREHPPAPCSPAAPCPAGSSSADGFDQQAADVRMDEELLNHCRDAPVDAAQERVQVADVEAPRAEPQSGMKGMMEMLCDGQGPVGSTSNFTMDAKTWMQWAIGQCAPAKPAGNAKRRADTNSMPRRRSTRLARDLGPQVQVGQSLQSYFHYNKNAGR
jgi:hypothetical protein